MTPLQAPMAVAVVALVFLECWAATPALAVKPAKDWCHVGFNRYFCDESCGSYYYCNGAQAGELKSCASGTCNTFSTAFKTPPASVSNQGVCTETGGTCYGQLAPVNCQKNFTCSGHGVCDPLLPSCDCEDGFVDAINSTDAKCSVTSDPNATSIACSTEMDLAVLIDNSGSIGTGGVSRGRRQIADGGKPELATHTRVFCARAFPLVLLPFPSVAF